MSPSPPPSLIDEWLVKIPAWVNPEKLLPNVPASVASSSWKGNHSIVSHPGQELCFFPWTGVSCRGWAKIVGDCAGNHGRVGGHRPQKKKQKKTAQLNQSFFVWFLETIHNRPWRKSCQMAVASNAGWNTSRRANLPEKAACWQSSRIQLLKHPNLHCLPLALALVSTACLSLTSSICTCIITNFPELRPLIKLEECGNHQIASNQHLSATWEYHEEAKSNTGKSCQSASVPRKTSRKNTTII